MNIRKKLTVIGAIALSASAITGGAFVTSRAMADGPAPAKATLTVVSIKAGDTAAVLCTYDDVELPVVRPTATPVEDANGNAVGPLVIAKSATANGATGATGTTGAGTSSIAVSVSPSGSDATTGPSTQSAVPAIELPTGVITRQQIAVGGADSKVRPGTAAECDAMRPGAALTGSGVSASSASVIAGTTAP